MVSGSFEGKQKLTYQGNDIGIFFSTFVEIIN